MLYQHIINQKLQNTIICEDDINLENFYKIDNLNNYLISNYDIIFLGHTAETKGQIVKELFSIYKSVWPRGLFCYF